jgi:tRNA pseudouridine38-40 synthase
MFRVAMIIEYDGSNFFGYQKQINTRTVQGVIEGALQRIFGEKISTFAAGRTDTGVHANGQVVSFNCPNDKFTEINLKKAINANLPDDIFIKEVSKVSDTFVPRFDAKKRVYHYFIYNSTEPDLVIRKYAWWFPYELNIDNMRKSASYLEGEHDFTSFQKADVKPKNPIRIVYRIRIIELKKNLILIRVEGESFLRRMVRNIVGSLVKTGTGQWEPEKIKEVLEACDRRRQFISAPAHGLYLYRVLF